jgi:hypothetical protein
MGERFEKFKTTVKVAEVKAHFQRNKKTYVTGGVCFLVGVLIANREDIADSTVLKNTFIPVMSWRPESHNVIIELAEKSTPSKPVHLVGTDLYFPSLSEAARKTGHSLSSISQQVNGKIEHVGGDVFEVLNTA